ncbi:hypothetical protein JW992_16800 [candidate division KSB1 bacterium]|nr:hypothetical protein [candidate division KSB1 bacterium]
MTPFGKQLVKIMSVEGWSLAELAQKCGVSAWGLKTYHIDGHTSKAHINTVRKISEGTGWDWAIDDDGNYRFDKPGGTLTNESRDNMEGLNGDKKKKILDLLEVMDEATQERIIRLMESIREQADILRGFGVKLSGEIKHETGREKTQTGNGDT